VLDRPRRLSFTWTCSTWPDPGLTSVVNVFLEPREHRQTLMTIEHTLVPPGLVGQHARGWTAIARQLAEELAAAAPGPPPGASPLPGRARGRNNGPLSGSWPALNAASCGVSA